MAVGSLRALALACAAVCALANVPAGAADTVRIAYLGQLVEYLLPESFLDPPPEDEGIQGARLGVADNATTGRFTGQRFELTEALVPAGQDVTAAFRSMVADGHRLIVAALPKVELLKVASLPEAASVTLFNIAAPDDELRGVDCRANILHVLPSRAMLADALVQYLVVKRWPEIFLVVGKGDADRAYADAVKRAAKKFRARIVEEKPWTFEPGARRTDTGHYSVQAEVARFTKGVSYDVLVVADEAGWFGNDLLYRTTEPRPVAGTQGLTPTAWARPHEQWGATQLQSRFLRHADRWMTDKDYAAWMAVRAIGEGATRTKSADPEKIVAHIRGDRFELAAFKGQKLTFRDWNGQLRQPVLLASVRSLVSVSPQPGFLHQYSELDTLGADRPESTCKLR